MILLPIGHDDSAVRRQPWVTYTLMALCFVALLATNGRVAESDERLGAAQERLVAALDAWAEHPYLLLRTSALEPLAAEQAQPYRELSENVSLPPEELTEDERAFEQAQLDAELLAAAAELRAAQAAHPYRAHGFVPGAITLWGLLAHMFMHAGWMHLLGNLFMLFIAGPALEDRWGRPLFAAVYAGAGLGGALLFAAFSNDPGIPLVGASGAIAGVFGAFLVRFWSTQIRFWYLLWFGFRVWTGTFERPAYLMLPLWLANELFQALISHAFELNSGVANTAHIGGFAVGAAAALAVKLSKLDGRLDRAIDEKTSVVGNLAVVEALALREQGDLRGAIQKLAQLVKRGPRDAEAVDAYWDACVAAGCAGDAAHAVLALAQRELAANDGARAAQRFLEVRAALPDYGFDPAFVARLVPSLQELDRELAKRALRWLAQPGTRALAPTLGQRALDAARALDPLVAKQLARKLSAASELPPDARTRFAAAAKALEAEAPDPPATADGVPLASESLEVAGGEPTPDWDHTARAFESEADAASASAASAPSTAELTSPELTDPEELSASDEGARDTSLIASADDGWDALKLLDAEEAPVPAPPAPRFASLKLAEATPLALADGALRIALDGGRKAQLALARVDAVALAAVRGLSGKPVLVVDLLLGWRSLEGGELRGVRLRSDRFDPRKLASARDPLAALRELVAQLVAAADATPLHAADPARANALTPFADAATYEREVLEVGA